MKVSELFGLPTAHAEVKRFGSVKSLVVERFDRKWSEDGSWLMRLPQEDMCQALGYSPHLKYQADGGPGIVEIMKLLLGSTTADMDRTIFFKAQILFWILAAPDGHAKNFSLHILPEGRYQLTPLYDIISFYPYFGPFNPARKLKMAMYAARKLKMAMYVKGKSSHYHWERIQPRHFAATAKMAGFSEKEGMALVKEMLDKAESVSGQARNIIPAGFPEEMATKILDGMTEFAKAHLRSFA